MSYDLLFLSDSDQPSPNPDIFLEHFTGRAFYTVENGQAIYQNPDTGVYFIFELVTETLEGEPPSWASFILNLFRPHYFALESIGEIEAFIARTNSIIFDPQDAEPSPRRFDSQRFLDNWNHGNHRAYQLMTEQMLQEGSNFNPLMYPTERLEMIWRWNLDCQRRQDEVGDDIFIPKVSFLNVAGQVQSAVVWTDAIPTYLPEVDVVLIYRDQIRKRTLLGGGPTIALVRWDDLGTHLAVYPHRTFALPLIDLSHIIPSNTLVDFLRSLPTLSPKHQLVSMDSILNAELFPEPKS